MISAVVVSMILATQPTAAGGDKSMANSPIVPVPYQQVTIDGPFWSPRLQAIRRGTLSANRHQCDITGRLANFDNAAKKLRGEQDAGAFEGLLFNDSDVYKMIEGWCYLLATETDTAAKQKLDSDLDVLIAHIAAAQHPDGYINTYYTLKADLKDRFTREEWDHETYCMGHLIEAAVAHFQATGKRSLLDVAIRAADFLDTLYGPEKFTAPPGHQEVELALIRFGDALNKGNTVRSGPLGTPRPEDLDKYTRLAFFLIEQRGREHRKLDGTMYGPWGDYAQDHLPAAEQTEAAGHAVRAAYFYSAMTDLAARGVGNYRPALDSLWTDITQRRVFVTGGIGPSGHNEGFTTPYDIPTHTAYQETCASIGLCMWAHRMFLLTGRAEYMEQFERTLYNAVLAGVALDGESFFYVNPLASRGGHRRSAWFGCACCPPNVLRFVGGLGQYIYASRGNTVYVNLFVDGSATLSFGGHDVKIVQETGYPFDGRVKLTVTHDAPYAISLAIRMPEGSPLGPSADGYIHQRFDRGTTESEFIIPLPVRRVVADPRVKQAIGRVAIMRGPLVYAAESIDNDGTVAGIILPPDAELEERLSADGTPEVIVHALRVMPRSDDGEMSRDLLYREAPGVAPVEVVMRPYFMWANRGPSEMTVWLPETAHLGEPWPAPGITAAASFTGHGDGLPALYDRIEPASSIDHDIPRFTFWSHKGTEEWVRYDFDKPRTVSAVEIYWFDDTGRGECRVPASWTVEVLDGETWKPVTNAGPSSPAAFGTAKDRFNVCAFAPVVTGAVRVNIKLQEKYSTGILEMRVR